MSFKLLIKEHFPNTCIGNNSVTCPSAIMAIGVIDLMIKSAFAEDIPENFTEKNTKLMIYQALNNSENTYNNYWMYDYKYKENIIKSIMLENNSDVIINAFMLVRNISFKVNGQIIGQGDQIDIHLYYNSKHGWIVRQSFPLDD
jgi:hypothetical protein